MFVIPPHIPNIDSLPQSTISSLNSGSFVRNRDDMNIQQQTTSEVADTETVMADNEDLYPRPPQDILNVFSAANLLSCSSYMEVKIFMDAWLVCLS